VVRTGRGDGNDASHHDALLASPAIPQQSVPLFPLNREPRGREFVCRHEVAYEEDLPLHGLVSADVVLQDDIHHVCCRCGRKSNQPRLHPDGCITGSRNVAAGAHKTSRTG
jgi:hypothetical protein